MCIIPVISDCLDLEDMNEFPPSMKDSLGVLHALLVSGPPRPVSIFSSDNCVLRSGENMADRNPFRGENGCGTVSACPIAAALVIVHPKI